MLSIPQVIIKLEDNREIIHDLLYYDITVNVGHPISFCEEYYPFYKFVIIL